MKNNKSISPAAIGEYLSFDHCSRYFKHRVNEITDTENHTENEFSEAFNPLDILLAQTGEEFEQDIYDNLTPSVKEIINLDTGSDKIDPDHNELLEIIESELQSPPTNTPILIYQPTIAGEINNWNVGGHADFIFIWSTSPDQIELRVIDAKSAKEQQTYHQVQSALYVSLIEDIIKENPTTTLQNITLSAGVITRNTKYTPPHKETIPSFEWESRINDIHRLLDDDNEIPSVNTTPLSEADHQLDTTCSGCAYNEACTTESFEDKHIRLLGLTTGEQTILENNGIKTITDLADLCTEPREWEWEPTNQKTAGFANDTYRSLKSTPGLGEKLPNLIYRAQAINKQLSDTDENTFPAAWIPGTGKCDLPDDAPPEDFEFPYERGSMIRIYLNVQYDHLRDKIIQISARITATGAETEPQRISILSDTAPTDKSQAREVEKELLETFISKLYAGIQSVTAELNVEVSDQQHPLVHFYTYTPNEEEELFEACSRYNTQEIDSFQDLLEGRPGEDKQRISHLKPEIKQRVCIASPSYGLMHAYDELQPPTDAYSKSRSAEEWSYDPSYTTAANTVNLRKVFNRRIFNITVDWENKNGNINVKPTDHTQLDGLKTRFRHGGEIPLGYHWAAIGRIDSQWKNQLSVDTSSGIIQYEINSYLYHNAQQRSQKVTVEDVETVGKHICDVIEHIERSLIYRDAKLCGNKDPVDITKLTEDTHTTPTIGEASQEYLWMEHTTQQHEIYEQYRDMPSQRILSGESLPVQILDIEEDTGNHLTAEVTAKLRYDELFGDFANKAKLVCKQKGNEGTSSGDWMVANPFDPGRTDQVISEPYELEAGINASITHIDMKEEIVKFELRNSYWKPGKFDSYHRNYTTDESRANNDEDYTHITPGGWLILDPLTDNLTADRANKALETIDSNNLHTLLEQLRYGNENALSETEFSRDHLTEFANWLSAEIKPPSYPNSQQREFITSENQVTLLQGPPGTGKTSGTLAPSLLARIHAAEKNNTRVNALITAPSNTAIDEIASATAELLDKFPEDGHPTLTEENIDILRLSNTEPETSPDQIKYADYNADDDEAYLQKVHNRLTGTVEDLTESTPNEQQTTEEDTSNQQTFSAFTDTSSDSSPSGEDEDATNDGKTHTLVFATPTKSWGLLSHFESDDAEIEDIAAQEYWNLFAADEASMLTTPKLMLAGVGVKKGGQYLISGDHQQLPPVQKHDWDGEYRRSILEAAPYLSSLDYFRLLHGDMDVLPDEHKEAYEHAIDTDTNPLPMVKLNTSYRFGPSTAEFIQSTVYEEDNIDYTSNRSKQDIEVQHTATTDPIKTAYENGEITLITYNAEETYQQVNLLEATISQALLQNHHQEESAGLVTPHNAQRSRLREMLRSLEQNTTNNSNVKLGETTFVETVERFQGGEQDLMIVSATATDPQYIKTENEFLLEKNRANVSFTRHKNKLIVIAAESLLSHIPSDPDVYDEAILWKTLPRVVGESPSEGADPHWSGSLSEFVSPLQPPKSIAPDQVEINIYSNE